MVQVAPGGVGSGDHQFNHHSVRGSADLQKDVDDLVDILSKLNPSAKEFFPSSYSLPNENTTTAAATSVSVTAGQRSNGALSADAPVFVSNYDANNQRDSSSDGSSNGYHRRRRNNQNQGRRRINDKVRRYQREDRIRRTVYVAEIDQHITEEDLVAMFAACGPVVDCRACGDPNSVLRFAFVEFSNEQDARKALNLSGVFLGYYPLKVLPSKTAILPVNPQYLPQTEDEKEMCVRTIYCTNIDKKISQEQVKSFFESTCGKVLRLRLLGDHLHSTHIAFVEFVQAESAVQALGCSGAILGNFPIRVSPSKTPVRKEKSQ
ncbi:putative Poly(A)-binding protein [Zostera marina]|uniref:Putative Poly(A)-binding protein n=1 Tax=Zostera marina TaxID=29655 RepID=A0A0K9Q3N4_ZOSMR|nr:putative Poly(A)-binding protein [Zostera marina]